jgi:nucleotide-binding universal stress UspA family protein
MNCGRPLLIAPDFMPTTVTGTIVVGWKETPEAAHALGAAWPLLRKANKVILLHMVEREPIVSESLEHLARAASELQADMLVVGGFGNSRLREWAFGGVTQSLLEHVNIPVFMMH